MSPFRILNTYLVETIMKRDGYTSYYMCKGGDRIHPKLARVNIRAVKDDITTPTIFWEAECEVIGNCLFRLHGVF